MTTSQPRTGADRFTIAPGYVDRQKTVPLPDYRNVSDAGGTYVGLIVLVKGRWEACYSERWPDTRTVHLLTTAGDRLNA